MKKKGLIITTAVMMGLVSIGSYAFAKDINNDTVNNTLERPIVREDRGLGYGRGYGHCINQEFMIDAMRESGYEDMAKWMEEGNYEEIDKYMRNMTIEDHNKMMENIHQKRYEYINEEGRSYRATGFYGHHGMMGPGYGRQHRMGRF